MRLLRIRRPARRQRARRQRTSDAVRPDPGLAGPTRGATEPVSCPAARCARCGFVFPDAIVVATCPRCLEPFVRTACHASCWSCPLLRSEV
jgi:hypothetical protein